MGNLKGRVERLEGGRERQALNIIIVYPGENRDEVWQKHLAAHPELKAEPTMILDISAADQAPSSALAPSRPEPQYSPQAKGPGPLQIYR